MLIDLTDRSKLAWFAVALLTLGGAAPPARGLEPEPAPRDRIIGEVVDPDGRPVGGAAVFAAFDPGEDGPRSSPGTVSRTVANSAGRFDLAWPDPASGGHDLSVWVHHPGYRLSRASVPARRSGWDVRVVLSPADKLAGAMVEVVGVRGELVARARVIPTRWAEGDLAGQSVQVSSIPRPVGEAISAWTDAGSRALLPDVAALRLAGVAIEVAGASQLATWESGLIARHRVIRLRPVGRVLGQVEGGPVAQVAGLTVRIGSESNGRAVGAIQVTTDATGHFEAADVVAGLVSIQVESRPGSTDLADPVSRQTLEPGGTLNSRVALRRGVQIRGSVVEQGPATPIVGAWLTIAAPNDPAPRWVRTDESGRFAAVARAGPVAVRIASAPPPFLAPSPDSRPNRVEIPGTIADFAWPTIELQRGATLSGRVLADDGQPVGAGVAVAARWTRRSGRAHDDVVVAALTSTDGTFAVGPTAPGMNVTIEAHRPGDQGGSPMPVAVTPRAEPVVVTLGPPTATLTPIGRVIDSTGRPVAGALVQFRVADHPWIAHGARSGRRLAAAGFDAVVTDEQGRYTASGRLDARHRYFASAEASGCESGRTRLISGHSAIGSTLRFPDLVVERHYGPSVVVGRVVGTDGQPIAGVTVRDNARHEAITGASGWFRLEGTGAGGSSFLFAERADYRFFGRSLVISNGDADHPIQVILTRTNEPMTDRTMADQAGDDWVRRAVASLIRTMVVVPFVDRTLARHDPVATASLLERLVEVDPARVLTWVRAGAVMDHRAADGLRRVAARQIARDDFARAEPVLAAIEAPSTRFRATLDAVGAARSLDPARKRDLIVRVEREVRSVDDLGQRSVLLARVADGWLDLGEADRARQCVEQAEEIAGVLPRATQGVKAWNALIPTLARLDPAAARRRLDNLLDPTDLDRSRLLIAVRLIPTNPTEAVRLFDQIRDRRIKLRATPEFCYLLGPVSPPLARTLVDAIRRTQPSESAYALGMLAAGLAPTDRGAALATLREAFDRLGQSAEPGPALVGDETLEPAVAAAALLPVVEAIGPTLLAESFWKTVALHALRGHANHRSDAILALMLDRYDRTAARIVFDPARIQRSMIAGADLASALLAAAQIAPDVALHWAEPPIATDDPSGAQVVSLDQAQFDLIAHWSLTDLGRREYAARHHLDLWTPGDLSSTR